MDLQKFNKRIEFLEPSPQQEIRILQAKSSQRKTKFRNSNPQPVIFESKLYIWGYDCEQMGENGENMRLCVIVLNLINMKYELVNPNQLRTYQIQKAQKEEDAEEDTESLSEQQ